MWYEELDRLRHEQEQPAQVPLELPLYPPYEEPPEEASPDPEAVRGVIVIDLL